MFPLLRHWHHSRRCYLLASLYCWLRIMIMYWKMGVYLVVLIRLLIVLMATVPADFDTILCNSGTEVCWPGLQYNISCICRASSTRCFWTTFSDRRNILTNGTTESLLVWHSSTLGYGQFTCISRRDSSSDNVERNVLIIPNGEVKLIKILLMISVMNNHRFSQAHI